VHGSAVVRDRAVIVAASFPACRFKDIDRRCMRSRLRHRIGKLRSLPPRPEPLRFADF